MAAVLPVCAVDCFRTGILPRSTESPECFTAALPAICWREMSMNL